MPNKSSLVYLPSFHCLTSLDRQNRRVCHQALLVASLATTEYVQPHTGDATCRHDRDSYRIGSLGVRKHPLENCTERQAQEHSRCCANHGQMGLCSSAIKGCSESRLMARTLPLRQERDRKSIETLSDSRLLHGVLQPA